MALINLELFLVHSFPFYTSFSLASLFNPAHKFDQKLTNLTKGRKCGIELSDVEYSRSMCSVGWDNLREGLKSRLVLLAIGAVILNLRSMGAS
jgi:hypothetical protein